MLQPIETQSHGELNYREFMNNFPAVEIAHKQYSLEADIITGWKPKVKILGPIPFNFDCAITDQVVEELTSFGRRYKQRVIYLGYRYSNSFKMHQQINRQYVFKHEAAINTNYMHMAAYFRKFHANFKSKNNRIFRGMNPTLKPNEQVVFDSNYEGGNIDAVIRIAENEYDLFMRVDTNTRGHVQWFNFTVKNNGRKKLRFNIVNFKKLKTLYQRNMKPYVYSQHLKQTKDLGWFQGGDNVKYSRRKLVYGFLQDSYQEDQLIYNCLQFDYTFQVDWEIVQFAYSPSFTYSDTISMIKSLKSETISEGQSIIKQDVLCESLGGLQISLLTITDPEVDDKKKKCVLISGRIHPGQTCSSFMGKGILQFICSDSEQAKYLRRHIVFKVIPMLNPDGVVVGNFRTSLCGKDLNRAFKLNTDLLIPQVRGLKELVIKLKNEFKSRLIFFLDLHGHSVKKNVFLYGPEYEIWQSNYYKTRIFPKILSSRTEMFRYYSCLFRIADFKRTTARAIVLRNVPHCYTIQASTGFYYSSQEKKDIAFNPEQWMQMGRVVAQSIKEYLDLLYDEQITKIQRKQKIIELKTFKNRSISKKQSDKKGTSKFQTRIQTVSSNQKSKNLDQQANKNHYMQQLNSMSQKARDLIEQIKNEQKTRQQGKKEEGHESDRFSEGGSDSESAGQDIPEEELNKLHKDILESMEQFRIKFYSKSDRQLSLKETGKKKIKDIQQSLKPRRESHDIELIASLRKKAESIEKAREAFVWQRMKEHSKELKSRKSYEINLQSILGGKSSFRKTDAKFKSRLAFGINIETPQITSEMQKSISDKK